MELQNYVNYDQADGWSDLTVANKTRIKSSLWPPMAVQIVATESSVKPSSWLVLSIANADAAEMDFLDWISQNTTAYLIISFPERRRLDLVNSDRMVTGVTSFLTKTISSKYPTLYDRNTIIAFTDGGSALKSGKQARRGEKFTHVNSYAGYGIFMHGIKGRSTDGGRSTDDVSTQDPLFKGSTTISRRVNSGDAMPPTVGRAELLAAIGAMVTALENKQNLALLIDRDNIIKYMTDWIPLWRRRNADISTKKNSDLLGLLMKILPHFTLDDLETENTLQLSLMHVPSHGKHNTSAEFGNEAYFKYCYNEAADTLATAGGKIEDDGSSDLAYWTQRFNTAVGTSAKTTDTTEFDDIVEPPTEETEFTRQLKGLGPKTRRRLFDVVGAMLDESNDLEDLRLLREQIIVIANPS